MSELSSAILATIEEQGEAIEQLKRHVNSISVNVQNMRYKKVSKETSVPATKATFEKDGVTYRMRFPVFKLRKSGEKVTSTAVANDHELAARLLEEAPSAFEVVTDQDETQPKGKKGKQKETK